MAQKSISQLTALTTPAASDILYIVDDPSGSADDRKITLENLHALPDDTPLSFGANDDTIIQYDEATDDRLEVTGTANWHFGDGLRLEIDEIRARDGDGLKLYDDAGNGIFVEDGGQVGIGMSSPSQLLEVAGTIEITDAVAQLYWLQTGASADNGRWDIIAESEQFKGRAVNDAMGVVNNWIVVGRTDTTIDQVVFPDSNIGIGTTDQFGGGGGVIGLHDAATNPSSNPTAGIVLYSDGGELKVRDSGGNTTTLSPHQFDLTEPSEDMAWCYHSERDGKTIEVDMLRVVRLLEKLTGETLVHEEVM